jgi:class 3 adenylate cyclase/tetratricopeptide (TPR) repeat protein
VGASSRKTVTVVFCDLVGSTALGERTDPEVLRELMGRYHAALRAILERHGGTVEKFVGDAAMAVFGIPQVHEDDALRAVRAAAEMREAVAALGLQVRIGVNTGEVVTGAGETLVTGDAVNVAARLEQAAGGGEVLLGAATERLVCDAVRAEPVAPLELKGKSEPVPAYRLLELTPDVPAFTRPLRAPFVGRAAELERLEAALAAARERRAPQLATIVGPPGIGKSRLARELVMAADARVLVGRCLSYGEGITYWPLAEIAGQLPDLRAALGDGREAELAAARIGAALGTADWRAAPEEIAWGFRKLFETLARERPLIVVLDDIHWAEPTLLDLVEYLATFAQDAALLLLCTARGELFDARPTWAAPRPNATLLTLAPLAGGEVQALLERLGDLAPAVRARVVDAAEGNPLFVEQLVAMQAGSADGEVEIPPTLHALLSARIDALPEPERAVVECAAIEGRLFHRGAVAELLPEDERPGVGGCLLTLVRKELIRPDRAELPGDDGFRFAHILVRDAAYEAIPKRARAELHERYADWLTARLDEQAPPEILGHHLEQGAGYRAELGAPDAALGERAARHLLDAARTARGRQDTRAATSVIARAVALVPTAGPLRAELLAEQGLALYDAGELASAGETLREAAALAHAAGDTHVEWLARIKSEFVRLRVAPEGASEEAVREAQAAIAAVPGDHEVLAHAWYLIGEAHLMWARAAERGEAIERACEHARAAGDVPLEIELLVQNAPAIAFGPVPVPEGLRRVEALLAEKGDIPAVQGYALHLLGHLRARVGQFDEARAAIARWREDMRELGRELPYATAAGCMWDVCALAGDLEGGEAVLRDACTILEPAGEKSFLSTIVGYLAECVYRQGRLEEAERLSDVCAQLGASDDHLNEALWRAVRAKVLAARGEHGQALDLARTAVEVAARTDFLDARGDALLDLAEVLRAAGRDGEAAGAAAEALKLYERKGNRLGAQRAREQAGATAARARAAN